MKRFLAIITLMIMISATAQAGVREQEFAKQIESILIAGTDGYFKYSEKYQSFINALIGPSMEYREITEYEIEEVFLGMVEEGPGYFSQFPNTGIIYVVAKSENEIYWIVAKQAGIIFVYDNVAGEIIYSKNDDMPSNVHDFY